MMKLAVIFCAMLICVRNVLPVSTSGTDQMFINGDVYIGALASVLVHDLQKGDGSSGNQCNRLSADQVVQTEVMRLSIDHINRHLLKDSGYQLGLRVVNDGNDPDFGMQQAMSLMNDQQYSIDRTGSLNKDTSGGNERPLGLISTSRAEVVERADQLFRSFLVSTIGTVRMNDQEFSDSHPYLLTTAPSHVFLAKAINDLAQELKWYQFAVIYDNSQYGKRMYRSFSDIFEPGNGDETGSLCQPYFFEFDGFSESLVDIAERLRHKSIQVVVTAMEHLNAKTFYLSINTTVLLKNLQWVDINEWSIHDYSDGLMEHTLEDAIKIDFIRPELPILKDFLLNLTYKQVLESRNPWLIELVTWDYCSDTRSISTDDSRGRIKNGKKLQQYCNNDTKIELKNIERGVDRSFMIYQALVSYATAFESIRKTSCKNHSSLCDGFFDDAFGRKLIEQLQSVTIDHDDQLTDSFSYLNRNGPPFLSVFQCRNISDVRGGPAYQWLPVGQWHFGLRLNTICETTANNDRKELRNGCLINRVQQELLTCTTDELGVESKQKIYLTTAFSLMLLLPSLIVLISLLAAYCKRSDAFVDNNWLTVASFVPVPLSTITTVASVFAYSSPQALAFFKIPAATFWLTATAVGLIVECMRISDYALNSDNRRMTPRSLIIRFCSLLLVQVIVLGFYCATRLSYLDLSEQAPSIISEELHVLFAYPALLFFYLLIRINQYDCSNLVWVCRKRKCYLIASLLISTISVIFYVIYVPFSQTETISDMSFAVDLWLIVCFFLYTLVVIVGPVGNDGKKQSKCYPDVVSQAKSDVKPNYSITTVKLLSALDNNSSSVIILPGLKPSSGAKNSNTSK